MQFINGFILLLLEILSLQMIFFPVNANLTVFKKEKSTNENLIVRLVTSVAKTCLFKDLNISIFAGDFKNLTAWYYEFSPFLPIYRISLHNSWIFEHHKRIQGVYEINEHVASRLLYPTNVNIVSVLPLNNFTKLLKMMRESVTWNGRANTFLIDEDRKSRCSNVEQVFTETWKFYISQAIYVCYDDSGDVQFYSFNPFSEMSTKVWNLVNEIHVAHQNNIYTMLIFRLTNTLTTITPSTCADIMYEKTDYLNNYPIKLCGDIEERYLDNKYPAPRFAKNLPDTKAQYTRPMDHFKGFDIKLSKIIWGKLRVEPTVSIFAESGYIDKDGKLRGAFIKLFESQYDMEINQRFFRNFWRLYTYPHAVGKICAMTKRVPTVSSNSFLGMMMKQPKILFFIIGIASLATILFKKILSNVNYDLASLDVLRSLVGTSTVRQPDSTSSKRLIFIYIIIVIFGVNIYLGGKLTSTFSSHEKDKNMNSMTDLVNENYQLMGHPALSEFLYNKTLRESFIREDLSDCKNRILKGEKVACFADCKSCKILVLNDTEIHVSRGLITPNIGFIVQPDWPILPRINLIIQQIRESGVITFEYRRQFQEIEDRFSDRKKIIYLDHKSQSQSDSLPLNRLSHALIFYAFATLTTFAIFLWEIFEY